MAWEDNQQWRAHCGHIGEQWQDLLHPSLTRMTSEQEWGKKIFESVDIPQMDTTMDANYTEGSSGGPHWQSHH
eukprot:5714763-Amphidinium_carterae.1